MSAAQESSKDNNRFSLITNSTDLNITLLNQADNCIHADATLEDKLRSQNNLTTMTGEKCVHFNKINSSLLEIIKTWLLLSS